MGGGDAVEKVSSDEIEVMLARSFQPVSGRPYRFEGLEPDFCPIIPMTLSELRSLIRPGPLRSSNLAHLGY